MYNAPVLNKLDAVMGRVLWGKRNKTLHGGKSDSTLSHQSAPFLMYSALTALYPTVARKAI